MVEEERRDFVVLVLVARCEVCHASSKEDIRRDIFSGHRFVSVCARRFERSRPQDFERRRNGEDAGILSV